MIKLSLQKILFFTCFVLMVNVSMAQTQIGNDIDGESDNNWCGASISMPDETTIAIVAPLNDDVANRSGHVRVYTWNGFAWVQKGNDVDGQYPFDKLGQEVSMPDANTFAAGLPGNAQSVNPYGRVQVYAWNGTAWTQKGSNIDGISSSIRFGYSLNMPDSNTIAVGALGGSTWNDNLNGKVYVYTWNGTAWVQKGSTIDGEASGDNFGYKVSMPNANTLAVSAPFNDASGNNAGHVRIYTWNGSDWVQKGNDIDGEAAEDNSGWSISMPDINTVAIGAPKNAGGGYLNGHVRIYSWNGSAWVKKGNDIDGGAVGDRAGYAISMSDSNHIAIGSPYNGDTLTNSGKVGVYKWNGSAWERVGNEMRGEGKDDESGTAVAMGSNKVVAIGAYENEGNGGSAGHVRIYSLDNKTSLTRLDVLNQYNLYPSPNNGAFNIDLGNVAKNTSVKIFNELGVEIANDSFENCQIIELVLNACAGVYFVETIADGNRSFQKMILK